MSSNIDPIGTDPVGASDPVAIPGYSVSVTEDMILMALRSFLLLILGDSVEVVKGQANKVPEPSSPDFVVMTHVNRSRTSTNVDTWAETDPNVSTIQREHGTTSDVQLDVHGPNSTDNAQIITTLWRDDFGTTEIDRAIFSPLYASDGHQMPFINGENQYEDRWVITVTLQSKPVISTSAQFTATLTPIISALGSAVS